MIEKVIFVDEDNTGLGPFAAALLRKSARERGSKVAAASRGTVVLFPEPANRWITEIAAKYGVDLSTHQAKALTEDDLSKEVLMLALDSASQKRAFAELSGFSKIFILKEYVGETGDIRVPLGEGEDKYEAACETVARLVEQLIEKLVDEEIMEPSEKETTI